LTQTTLTRDGVTLRPWSDEDADALVARVVDPAIASFLDRIPQPYTHADAQFWFEMTRDGWASGSMATFGVHVDGIEGVVGGIGVRFLDGLDEGGAEVGYWVAAETRGRGVATTATRLAVEWAFTEVPELARMQLRADVDTAASNRVAEKAGFTREGVLRSQRYNERLGRRVNFVMWSLLREEV
jgi:RimJ/RimL family protein N-acetyltransferase